jgi:hypothetical protein
LLKLIDHALAAWWPGLRLGLRLAFELEIERHCGADEILQGGFVDFVAFVDVDGAPDIAVEAGVEQMGRGFCGLDSVV